MVRRAAAIDVLAKYGFGTLRELSVDEVRDQLRATISIIKGALAPHQVTELLTRLRERWTR